MSERDDFVGVCGADDAALDELAGNKLCGRLLSIRVIDVRERHVTFDAVREYDLDAGGVEGTHHATNHQITNCHLRLV